MALWSEKHQPATEAELVVTKKKVADVKAFFAAGARRLLILKGPPGSGKASVLRAVCNDLGLEVVEWSPASSGQAGGSAEYREPLGAAFLRFIAQTDRYRGLESVSPGVPQQHIVRRRVTLVRDFPFTLLEAKGERSAGFLERFHGLVHGGAVQRAVFCFNVSRGDHFSVTRLLSQVDPSVVTTIAFESVAKTFVQRALDNMVRAEGLNGAVANTTSISAECGGDLRHAVNALQLALGAAAKLAPPTGKFGTVGQGGARPRARGRPSKVLHAPTPQDGASSQAGEADANGGGGGGGGGGLRPASLGLFHALGRLLYCKRVPPESYLQLMEASQANGGPPAKRKRANSVNGGAAAAEPRQLPPEFLTPKSRRPPLYFLPEDVLNSSNTEPIVVVDWLFTNAPRFYGDVGDLANFTAALAETDTWSGGWRGGSHSSEGGSMMGSSFEELGPGVQARALLDANQHPVPPTFGDPFAVAQAPEAAAFNMVRPLIRDVSRHRERRFMEIAASIEAVGGRALGCASATSALLLRTLPFVHLILQASRGMHQKLRFLPHEVMRLVKDLNVFDGSVLRGERDGPAESDGGMRGGFAPAAAAARFSASWGAALPEDPIEGFG